MHLDESHPTLWTPPKELWRPDPAGGFTDPYEEDPYTPDPYGKL